MKLPALTGRGQRWSMDFMRDTLAGGRPFRTLNIVDAFTRECLAIEVDRALPGVRVVRVLERLRAHHGVPAIIVVDDGPECVGRALDAWTYGCGVALHWAGQVYAAAAATALSRRSWSAMRPLSIKNGRYP